MFTRRSWLGVGLAAGVLMGTGCSNSGAPGDADNDGFWADFVDSNVNGQGEGGAPDPDSDGDGLSDAEELALGSDPNLADTDGDGWTDGEEVDGNTDPTRKRDHPYTGGWAIGACRDDITGTGYRVGDTVQQFELMDQNGENLKLHDFCDREVLLVGAAFW